jgi:hypothetical protein
MGWTLWSDANRFQQGPWERDRVVSERELYFACILWGKTCLRVRVLTELA